MTIQEALDAIAAGYLVVMPTDTVYGLSADPTHPGAVAALFSAKERPEDRAIPILAASLEDLEAVGVFDPAARMLAERYWPGPLTLVLRRAPGFDADLGGTDRDTVAVRVPDRDAALSLLRQSGPLAVTSANISGREPAETIEQARAAFGDRVATYVDDGPCRGMPSTIVSLDGEPLVLRRGPLDTDDVLSGLRD